MPPPSLAHILLLPPQHTASALTNVCRCLSTLSGVPHAASTHTQEEAHSLSNALIALHSSLQQPLHVHTEQSQQQHTLTACDRAAPLSQTPVQTGTHAARRWRAFSPLPSRSPFSSQQQLPTERTEHLHHLVRSYSSTSREDRPDPNERRDRIHVRGARFYGYHGVLPEENAVGQPFIVNIVLHCDLRAAGASDDLQQTVSYASVFSDVQAIMEGPPFALLERAAHEIARTLLANHGPQAQLVQVSIDKVHIPKLSAAVSSVGVEITRGRDDFPELAC